MLEIIVGKHFIKSLSFFEIEKEIFKYNYKLIYLNKGGSIFDRKNLTFNVIYTVGI